MTTKRVSCFIRKNTPELRAKLEELGYHCFGSWDLPSDPFIFAPSGAERLYFTFSDNDCDDGINWVDCGTNEKMFLALCALRDDSDYMQWRTNGVFWFQWKFKGRYDAGYNIFDFNDRDWHKATPDEIIEHFKTNVTI